MNTPTILERLSKIKELMMMESMGAMNVHAKQAYLKAHRAVAILHDDIEQDWQLELKDFIKEYENQ
jgi:hypothetical protein